MYFALLQKRLTARLRRQIQNGDFSEKGLARMTGVSQPHMHNVLKGIREFSPAIADRVLRRLGLNLLDLFEKDELAGLTMVGEYRWRRELPVLEGRLGPGHPMPNRESRFERRLSPVSDEVVLVDPALVHLAEDPQMVPMIREGDLALLDRAVAQRAHLRPESLYVITLGGEAVIRRVFQEERFLLAVTPNNANGPADWISLGGRHLLDIVNARVVWVGRTME